MEDLPTLNDIAFRAKASWAYPSRWLEAWQADLCINPSDLPGSTVRVASLNNSVLGFYLLTSSSLLEHLWVEPPCQRQGIGRILFEDAVRAASHPYLVIESDPFAVKFYSRMGCEQIGTRFSKVLGEPRELPILLAKAGR